MLDQLSNRSSAYNIHEAKAGNTADLLDSQSKRGSKEAGSSYLNALP